MSIRLYDYWRSTSSCRVRMALNLLKIDYEIIPIDLLKGEQRSPANLARNPQGLVPTLEIDGLVLTQSLAIIEYLHETRPSIGLLPDDPVGRARVRKLSYAIAMEIHPICNPLVARFAVESANGGLTMQAWMHEFIAKGLQNFETMLDDPATGQYCHGDQLTMADICLVAQIYNAQRWDVPFVHLPLLHTRFARLSAIDAIARAAPTPPNAP